VDTGIPQRSPAALVLSITYLPGIFDEAERAVPGIRGLSFVDDIGWWVDGECGEAVTAKTTRSSSDIHWPGSKKRSGPRPRESRDGDLSRRKNTPSTATVKVASNTVPFNKEVPRWLGVWLDSQLTLKDNHAIQLKNGKNAIARLRRLAGRIGLPPASYWEAMTARTQSVTMLGSEQRWERDQTRVIIGHGNETKLLTNQETRDHRLLTGNLPGDPVNGIGAQASSSPVGETGSGGLKYGCSAYRRATRLGRLPAPQQWPGEDSRTPSHARAGRSAQF